MRRLGLKRRQFNRLTPEALDELLALSEAKDQRQREFAAWFILAALRVYADWSAGKTGELRMGAILGMDWEEEQYRQAEARRIAAGEAPSSFAYLVERPVSDGKRR